MWGNLVSLSGLGLDDPGSNPGIPICLNKVINKFLQWHQEQKKSRQQESSGQVMEQELERNIT